MMKTRVKNENIFTFSSTYSKNRFSLLSMNSKFPPFNFLTWKELYRVIRLEFIT